MSANAQHTELQRHQATKCARDANILKLQSPSPQSQWVYENCFRKTAILCRMSRYSAANHLSGADKNRTFVFTAGLDGDMLLAKD